MTFFELNVPLFIMLLHCVISLNAQTKKVTKENIATHTIETYYVLDSVPEIRQGAYQCIEAHRVIKGQYKNGKKAGVWEYYGNQKLAQKYDYDSGKLIFSEPFKYTVDTFYVKENDSYVSVVPDQVPVFFGGIRALYSINNENIRYPASARKAGIDGKVELSAVVTADGKLTELKVEKGLTDDLNKAAMRVFEMLPNDWLPGKVNGEKRDIKVFFHIYFHMETD